MERSLVASRIMAFLVLLYGVYTSALVVFGLGLSFTVAPITSTVLAAAPTGKAGLASAINNCVARTGSLLAVAMLPAASGLGAKSYLEPAVFAAGYRRGMIIAAALCAAGGALAWLTMRRRDEA
jgi:hypothetical protein